MLQAARPILKGVEIRCSTVLYVIFAGFELRKSNDKGSLDVVWLIVKPLRPM
jgi:hypothetical protein